MRATTFVIFCNSKKKISRGVIYKKKKFKLQRPMVLTCNQCGSFNPEHCCPKGPGYQMVEIALQKKKRPKDDEEYVFGDEKKVQDDDDEEQFVFGQDKKVTKKKKIKDDDDEEALVMGQQQDSVEDEEMAIFKKASPPSPKKPSVKRASLKRAAPTTEAKKTKKRKKDDDKKEIEREPACVLDQKINSANLMELNELELSKYLEPKIQALFNAKFFVIGCDGKMKRDPDQLKLRVAVTYTASSDEKGRVYSRDNHSLQTLPAGYRRLLCHSVYHDVDISNCGPCLFPQIVTKALAPEVKCPDILREYARDRNGVFAKVRAESGFRNASDAELKKLFILCLTSAPGLTPIVHNGKCSQTISEYRSAVERMAVLLAKQTDFSEELAFAIAADEDQRNKLGRFVANIGFRAERKVLFALKQFFEESGYNIGVLIHDGLFVERRGKTQRLPDNVLEDAMNYIKEQTGFSVVLVEKSLQPTAKDLAILDGPKIVEKIQTNFLRCTYLLSCEALLHKLKRMDNNVYRPHPSIPGVYVPAEEHLDFINKTLCSSPWFKSVKNDDLINWNESERRQTLRAIVCLEIRQCDRVSQWLL